MNLKSTLVKMVNAPTKSDMIEAANAYYEGSGLPKFRPAKRGSFTVKPGDYVAGIFEGTLPIYGKVSSVNESEIQGTWYSAQNLKGEEGSCSVKVRVILTSEEFEYCRSASFPDDPYAIQCIGEGVSP